MEKIFFIPLVQFIVQCDANHGCGLYLAQTQNKARKQNFFGFLFLFFSLLYKTNNMGSACTHTRVWVLKDISLQNQKVSPVAL